MNIFSFKIFQFLYLTIEIVTKISYYILPFKTQYPLKIIPEKYFEIKFYNEPRTILTVGTHEQLIPCYLSINTDITYISGSNSILNKNEPKYNEYKSKKYHNISNKIEYNSLYIYGIPSIDVILLNNDKNIDIKFYLTESKFSSNELNYSCILGLGYDSALIDFEDDYSYSNKIESFITQMKNNEIINKKIFFINYNQTDDNGEIILGSYPHEIKNNYCESLCYEDDYIEIENNFINDMDIIWSIKGYIYIGEKQIYEYLCSIDFELNQGFIIGSRDYKENIEKHFFNENISKKICFKKDIYIKNDAFEVFYCRKGVDMSTFDSLKIYVSKIKYEIIFDYKDIFEEKDEYLFFNVIFAKHEFYFRHDFILGKPFFKKYPVVFNVEGKVEKIGFYQNLFIKIKDNKNQRDIINNNSEYKWNKLNFYSIKFILGH